MMNYEEARIYLNQVAEYDAAEDFAPMQAILHGLHDPQGEYQAILVGGATGKSSVSAYLADILLTAGYRVGRFSSSTDTDYLERFLVNGVPISEDEYAACISKIEPLVNICYARSRAVPSVFDLEVTAALLHFARESCEIVILESGLGYARDAVNVIEHPLMSILTPVCVDKLESFAEDPADIAFHMASIIHGNHPVILAPQTFDVKKAIYTAYVYAEREQMELGNTDPNSVSSPFRSVDPAQITIYNRDLTEQNFAYRRYELSTGMRGVCQTVNAATAVLAAETLQNLGFHITGDYITDGIARTKLFGRFTVLQGEPAVILDAAQNEPGAQALAESVRAYYPEERIVLVMGVHRNSPAKEMLAALLPIASSAYFAALPNSNRSMPPEVLRAEAEAYGRRAQSCFTYGQAIRLACEDAGPEGVVVICGSMTLLKDMKEAYEDCV